MTLLGQKTYNENLNDIWSDVHNGREYAFVGTVSGLSIVDISDPSAPFEVFFAAGPNTIWRDPFYYNGHAYCVNEESGGLLIVDMSPLPGPGPAPAVTQLQVSNYTGVNFPFTTGHTTSVDEQGHAYIYGSDYGVGGVIILDLSQDPANPVELGVWNQYYIHDGFARGDTLWAGCINNGFAAVVDISDPTNPQLLTTWNTPSNFTHNIWPNDDNSVVFTTDEVSSAFITSYDVTDLSNVEELDRIHHPLSEGVIPHNVYYLDDYLISSHYRDGVTIHDASDPENLVLTGYYDTSPLSGDGFNSVWGVWPYLPSGNIVASDMEGGLFIFGPNYTRAARIQGTVTNFSTGVQLSGVSIQVVGTAIQENTGIFGTYASGLAQAGAYDVTFIKGGFLPQTISGVQLINGQTTILDVQLVPDIPFTLQIDVTEQGTGTPVGNTTITFKNSLFDIATTTDGNGQLTDANFYDGTYEVLIGRWGYVTQCTTVTVNQQNTTLSFELEKQYFDDFAMDLGWQVSGNAPAGIWERDAPIATDFDGQICNPGSDSGLGCGDFAYITGNAGPPAGEDDVDDGTTILTTPAMDLSDLADPVVHFHYWFYTGGGSSASNDEFTVKVNNGIETTTIESLSTTNGQWVQWQMALADHITITANMKLELHIGDAAPGHLVEGGLDQFYVDETIGISESQRETSIAVYPNPASAETFQVHIADMFNNASLRITDISGKTVVQEIAITRNLTSVNSPSQSGIYLVELLIDGQRTVKRLAVHR